MDPELLLSQSELTLDNKGELCVARCALMGFDVPNGQVASFGPFSIRNKNSETDSALSDYVKAYRKTAVLELRYRERSAINSIYAEPSQAIEHAFVALQILINGWVGMSLVHHYAANGNERG